MAQVPIYCTVLDLVYFCLVIHYLKDYCKTRWNRLQQDNNCKNTIFWSTQTASIQLFKIYLRYLKFGKLLKEGLLDLGISLCVQIHRQTTKHNHLLTTTNQLCKLPFIAICAKVLKSLENLKILKNDGHFPFSTLKKIYNGN